MLWGRYLPECLLALLFACIQGSEFIWRTQASSPLKGGGWTPQRKLAARERTRDLWYHGYNNYMTLAFPLDELTPLSCSGQGPDWANPKNIAANDVAGNFSLTLIDVIDTFVILDDRPGFEAAVRNIINWVSFDVNTKPQIFETTIRVMGGLLSGHIFASNRDTPFYLPWYNGELLSMAHDLGQRLLPAFATPTGLPLARINLRHGLVRGETLETCTAGAGSLILEFATLSRLTGDDRFEKAAYKAFFALWNRKSPIGLVGNTINTWSGTWTSPEITGIGAGIDSFYEYALKWYILSGEVEFLDVWDEAYATVMRYSRATDGFWYRTVYMNSGDVAYFTIDSLSAFWPGLQVLAGDVQSAIRLHLLFYNIWREHSGLPEVFDTNFKQATSHQYPLRPEFIESTWYLYRATRDPFYLDVAERVLFDLTTRAKVECGLSGIQDLRTNKRDDRMESFALSETLKYLYLIFDEDNPLHRDDSNYVFTTEGHLLTLAKDQLKPLSSARKRLRKVDSHQCPAYEPMTQRAHSSISGLVRGIQSRGDFEYARFLVGLHPTESDMNAWSLDGWCDKPRVDIFSYDFILSATGEPVPEDLSPSLLKLGIVSDGYIIQNLTGIRALIVRRFDGKGYEIRKLGHYNVRPGQYVYVNDSSLVSPEEGPAQKRDKEIQLHFVVDNPDPLFEIQSRGNPMAESAHAIVTGFTASFGADLFANSPAGGSLFARQDGLPVRRETSNSYGCKDYSHVYQGEVVLVRRGDCTFLEKLLHAKSANATGVIVISDEDHAIHPTANAEELQAAGDISDTALVLLPLSAGQVVAEMMTHAEEHHARTLLMMVDSALGSSQKPASDHASNMNKVQEPHRILYLNGHPLVNTRLMI